MLPRLPHIPTGNLEHPAHQGDSDGLHKRPRGHQHRHAQEEPQHGRAHKPNAERWHWEGQLVQRGIGQQPQVVVDMGGQGHTGTGAQDLCGVTPRGAPGIQGEGEEAQAQVEGDDDERGVGEGQVEVIDQVQGWQEDQQDHDAVQEAGYDIL